MPKFKIEAIEVQQRKVILEVEAETSEKAREIVQEKLEELEINFDKTDWDSDFETRVLAD